MLKRSVLSILYLLITKHFDKSIDYSMHLHAEVKHELFGSKIRKLNLFKNKKTD